jgi:cysteinyl-tRNA synthetase
MAMKYLGATMDIHGGGEDLLFPHHENENAQSQAITGKPLARFWLHNGYLKIQGEKMSKSLNNFWLARDIMRSYPYQVVRLFLLSAHYRSPLDFSESTLQALQRSLDELDQNFAYLAQIVESLRAAPALEDPAAEELTANFVRLEEAFFADLDDDLNTPAALGRLHQIMTLAKQAMKQRGFMPTQAKAVAFKRAHAILAECFHSFGIEPCRALRILTQEEKELISQRQAARESRDWAKADQLRQLLLDNHRLTIEDSWIPLVATAAGAGEYGLTKGASNRHAQ